MINNHTKGILIGSSDEPELLPLLQQEVEVGVIGTNVYITKDSTVICYPYIVSTVYSYVDNGYKVVINTTKNQVIIFVEDKGE